ncbi:membrane-bound acyltransferase YfiQ involved in biofilm formation [Halomonas ventosae]|uniref:Membrane-bound acyltransferase YfiQ involved in biofilm formation n=1 Tax=Halomonas ventosae TaxID=229007 RepID=A0A4V3DP30_9GAMM|nr:acyltransferase family protein [Halomonas ventosae]TDR50746.1 membrane-bound acyltransferase YfiQ involved in biofilm formation [Halomonas ventosae]
MKRIEEIYWLRFYGCLAVFVFHLIERIEENYLEHVFLDLALIPTVLGTPIFIFISIFLFSARYGNEVPHNFLANRFKYVMVPYFVYGLIYSLAEYLRMLASEERVSFGYHMTEYLVFAGWHGYFLIVAMQFYVLFWLYNRFGLQRWLPSGPWLVVGSLISIGWWGFFRWQAIEPPGYLHWIAPLGWIYLFFLALLTVKHYPNLHQQPWFRRFSHPLWLVALLAGIVAFTLFGELAYSSKETWVVPLFIFSLLWAMSWLVGMKATPLVKKVNEYSFGIYLAHPLFFSVVDFVGWQVPIPLWLYVIALAVVGMSGSILLNRLANRAEWSGLLLGKRLRVA